MIITTNIPHRIHMLPLLPSSAYTRNATFVQQEWDAMFSANGCTPASTVSSGGWKGILYANQAIIDPNASFDFFNQPNFDVSWIDGGATRTWYLAYAAGRKLSQSPINYMCSIWLTVCAWFCIGLNGGS